MLVRIALIGRIRVQVAESIQPLAEMLCSVDRYTIQVSAVLRGQLAFFNHALRFAVGSAPKKEKIWPDEHVDSQRAFFPRHPAKRRGLTLPFEHRRDLESISK
jgi:hypothetical protein